MLPLAGYLAPRKVSLDVWSIDRANKKLGWSAMGPATPVWFYISFKF